jgi:hypothetical protein
MRVPRLCLHLCMLIALLPMLGQAATYEDGFLFRRMVNVTWDAERASGRELAEVTFHTAGHHLPDAKDVRVTTHTRKPVPFEILSVGPGDKVTLAFQLQKGIKDYAIYFGHKTPPPLAADGSKLQPTVGLLMETRRWNGQDAQNHKQIERAFEASTPALGKALIDRPFLGYNPVTEEQRTVSKITGSLFAPIDGDYTFAIAGDDRASLSINGKPVAFAQFAAGDARFNGKIKLTRGHHDMVIYHIDHGGEWRLSIGWQRPDQQKLEIIERTAVGFVLGGVVGPLEQPGKKLIADFKAEYLGECFFDDQYAHRYRFTGADPRFEYQWDFGDGQSAKGAEVEHVFLMPGVFPIKLQAKAGQSTDTQTTRFHVTRDLSRLDKPRSIEIADVSRAVKDHDLAKASSLQLARMIELHRRAEDRDAMLKACTVLAKMKNHPDGGEAIEALREAMHDAVMHDRAAEAVSILEQVPRDSKLQPKAAELLGEYLVWWVVDPKRAAAALEPYEGRSDTIKRLRGQALVLSGETKKGRALLESLPSEVEAQKRPALSGAMARTVEFYIGENDSESGEEQWQQWMRRFPADFLDGYSVLLRARLMSLRGAQKEAAKVAETFAAAVPESSYAPRLLHLASELLKPTDKGKSDALAKLLKERYPEDPLSQ